MSVRSIVEAYRILEIHSSSSQSEVKSAYKRLALKTHPDKNRNDPNANAKFQEVTDAFQMLIKMRFDTGEEDQEFSDDWDDDEFRAEDLPEVVFRFFFGNGTNFSSFSSKKNACNCVDCQFSRFFDHLAKQNASEKAKTTWRDPFISSQLNREPTFRSTPARAPAPAAAPVARPQNFDPHADWLSEGAGEVKAPKPKKFKKCCKKKKVMKGSSRQRMQKSESESEDSDHDTSDSSARESSVSSTSADNKAQARKPVPEFVLPSEANGFVRPSGLIATPRKTTFNLSVPEPEPEPDAKLQSKRAKKAALRRNKAQRTPRTPPLSHLQSSPRTPSSLATTHVGSYSAPTTPSTIPSNARTKTTTRNAAKNAPKTEQTTTRTKQPYVAPTLPTLEGVQLCRIFLLKHGRCRYGDSCRFSHGVAPGTALAASESDSEDGATFSSSLSPGRPAHASPSSSPPASVAITLSPKTPRSGGRAQVTVNPSIGGFGRKSAPRERHLSSAAHQSASHGLEVPRSRPVPRPSQSEGVHQPQRGAQHRAGVSLQSRSNNKQGNRYDVLSTDESVDASAAQKRASPVCAFYNTPSGCRFGQNCRFAHDLR